MRQEVMMGEQLEKVGRDKAQREEEIRGGKNRDTEKGSIRE